MLLRGGTPWMLDKLVESDVDLYIADSAAKGFNYMQLMTPTSPPYGTTNAYGAEPFVGAPFTTAINPDYWSHVEYIVDTAARYGIIVALVPAWIGYLPEHRLQHGDHGRYQRRHDSVWRGPDGDLR